MGFVTREECWFGFVRAGFWRFFARRHEVDYWGGDEGRSGDGIVRHRQSVGFVLLPILRGRVVFTGSALRSSLRDALLRKNYSKLLPSIAWSVVGYVCGQGGKAFMQSRAVHLHMNFHARKDLPASTPENLLPSGSNRGDASDSRTFVADCSR